MTVTTTQKKTPTSYIKCCNCIHLITRGCSTRACLLGVAVRATLQHAGTISEWCGNPNSSTLYRAWALRIGTPWERGQSQNATPVVSRWSGHWDPIVFEPFDVPLWISGVPRTTNLLTVSLDIESDCRNGFFSTLHTDLKVESNFYYDTIISKITWECCIWCCRQFQRCVTLPTVGCVCQDSHVGMFSLWRGMAHVPCVIRLEGPEDPHLRKSSFGGHVTTLTLQYLWPDPLGFDWEVLAASRGTAGGHSSRPPIKYSLGMDSRNGPITERFMLGWSGGMLSLAEHWHGR